MSSVQVPPSTNWCRLFLVSGFLAALAFAAMTPPFQVPDEITHFERAYEISEGELVSRQFGQEAGAILPDSISRLAVNLTDGIPFHPDKKIAFGSVIRAASLRLAPHQRAFVSFSNSALTSFVPYLPQASGIAVARLWY